MKRSDAQLISRGLDGELNAPERERLDDLLARDPVAAKTAQQWYAAGDAMRSTAARTQAPDPLLAWQDIRREIRRGESAGESSRSHVFSGAWMRAGALAAFIVAGYLGWAGWQHGRQGQVVTAAVPDQPAARVEWVEAEIPGATTMIFTDAETDLTVIWMDLAQNNDPRDT